VCWALYFGEKTHGVTLHRMTAEIDAGPILYQSIFPITETDTGLSVSLRCIQEGLLMVSRLLEDLTANPVKLPEIPQDLTLRQCLGREVPHHGRMIWSLPARQVVNFVRACNFCPFLSPWGHPRARKNGCEFGIVTATQTGCPAEASPGTVGGLDCAGVRIACSDEWISVGDESFQSKAQKRMLEITGKAGILVIASHDPNTLLQHCNLGMRIEKGKVTDFGPIEKVLNRPALHAAE